MFKCGPPKIVIATRKEFVDSIKENFDTSVGRSNTTEIIEKLGSGKIQTILEMIITSQPSIDTGEKLLAFTEWLTAKRIEKRGHGHVKYATLAMGAIFAMGYAERNLNATGSKLMSATTSGKFYEIRLISPLGSGRYTYLISRNFSIAEQWSEPSLVSFPE